jgi:hypothetical protein
MNAYKNPKWWSPDNDFAWDHVKLAMKRDWEQAKHGNKLNASQNIGHTARQAGGMEPIPSLGKLSFEELEPAFRFGYGARLEYGAAYPQWDDDFEIRVARDWRTMNPTRLETWEQDRSAIRYGWNFEAEDLMALEER